MTVAELIAIIDLATMMTERVYDLVEDLTAKGVITVEEGEALKARMARHRKKIGL